MLLEKALKFIVSLLRIKESNMKQHISHGPLVRFCLHPLIFTMNSAYQGVIAGIGILILYPFLSMVIDLLKKRIQTIDAFYITSFLGVCSGTLYVLLVGMVDWRLYKELAFVFPASMTATSMLIGWLEDHEHERESTPFIEAFISAILVVLFSCIRDLMLHGSLNFKFGSFGEIYNFGGDSVFENIINNKKYSWFSVINIRAMIFFIIAILIGIMGLAPSNKGEKIQ